ncbi:hypothetical protein EV03_1366 [Prochlorococcus marinus str. PAC1]|uniref:Uncharacterized protein n=1 Tax=Prochlorococcus marinus str. PAC1 TaxID=59924 RepID=A0A0A2C5K2_PROMR|nr:hypothetical protein EV03_1366 [Prochlorococcus marinus str. PAC1]
MAENRLVDIKLLQKNCIFVNLTTFPLANWIDKVGRTSKRDVKQKEKKG